MTAPTPEEVRAATAELRRLDGGGDDRPPVYWDPDRQTWVYRASSVGSCERALWLARTGVEKSPTPLVLMQAFVESANNEDVAIQLYEDTYEVEVEGRQARVEIEVGDGVVVSGSVDGIGGDSVAGQRGIVEVKCLGDDLWKRRGRDLLDEFYWGDQVQVYMRGAGLKLCWVVWGHKVDGVVDEIDVTVVEYDPRRWAKIRDRVLRVEAMAKGEIPPPVCETEKFGCPYWQLHEGKTDEVPSITDQLLGGMAFRRDALRREQQRIKDEIDTLNEQIDAELNARDVEKVQVYGRGFGTYRVQRVTQTRRTFDKNAAKRDGVDVGKYEKETTSSYVKVEKIEEQD